MPHSLSAIQIDSDASVPKSVVLFTLWICHSHDFFIYLRRVLLLLFYLLQKQLVDKGKICVCIVISHRSASHQSANQPQSQCHILEMENETGFTRNAFQGGIFICHIVLHRWRTYASYTMRRRKCMLIWNNTIYTESVCGLCPSGCISSESNCYFWYTFSPMSYPILVLVPHILTVDSAAYSGWYFSTCKNSRANS